jgi:hypothetical protein
MNMPRERTQSTKRFYLPENPQYTILDSLHDSVRFARRCLVDYRGHLAQEATFVDPSGETMLWHDFGVLEGPGWASNAIGGARNLYLYGRTMGKPEVMQDGLRVLDHVLDDGFIDWESGFITGYRHIPTDRLCLNYKSRDDWFCIGSMARMADQLLSFSRELGDDARTSRMQQSAVACGRWIAQHMQLAMNGWVPRRSNRDGTPYMLNPEGGEDILFERSADGVFLLDLWGGLTEFGLADYRDRLHDLLDTFVAVGGIFGSINHDTYDANESVAYAVTFRSMRRLAVVLDDERLREFAYDVALKGLSQFQMKGDRNGVSTQGLLFMERSWDTAYLWENAEASMAYLEAYEDTGTKRYLANALTILRAIAKHHHGPYGFLTEGVDWNNHVGSQHHFDGVTYGDIQYTEPLLNNLHHAEPALHYLNLCLGQV